MKQNQNLPLWRRLRLPSYLLLGAALLGLFMLLRPSAAEPEIEEIVAEDKEILETAVSAWAETSFEVPEPEAPKITWHKGNFGGKTFFNQLLDEGLTGGQIQNLINTLTPVYNFRKARPRHTWQLSMLEGEPQSFTLEVSPTEIYDVADLDKKPILTKREIETFTKKEVVRGTISGSLFQGLSHVEKPMILGLKLAEVFAWDVDFNRDPQNGDEFEILVESEYIRTSEGPEFHGYGKILAARYHARRKTYQAILFKPKGGKRGYYNQSGQSLIRAVLRSPLKVQIVTSRFNKNRFHPVLKRKRPHNGVDYGAKRGTPVMAVADGKVRRSGRYGGAGIIVELKHKDQMITQYFHLSKVASGMRPGARVRQGQVIGYVGKTGYATGYHLHFGMKIRGKFVDPQKQKFQPGVAIKKSQMGRFKKRMHELMTYFDPDPESQQVLGLAPDLFGPYTQKKAHSATP